MVVSLTKASLPPPRRHLLELMQQVDFGHIGGLAVCHGDPLLNPPPRVIREIKFGSENGPRPELALEDFVLKKQVVDLFESSDRLSDRTRVTIEVKHDLPFRMSVEETIA